MTHLTRVSCDVLEALALGTGILGNGGGTHPHAELLTLKRLLGDGKTVEVISPEVLDDGALVAEIGYMGAPLVTKERLAHPDQVCRPIRMMEAYAGCRFAAVMAGEIGSENGLLPIMAAARLGLPIVDADTMGRSFPEMQMSSFVIRGLPLVPFALADVRDNEVMITKAGGPLWVERIGRKACAEFGAVAMTCRPPRSGHEIKAHAVHGSLSRAFRLGAAVLTARAAHADPVAAVLAAEPGIRLFAGKVVDVARRTTEGFVRGRAMIEGLDGDQGHRFDLDFQNEFIVGRLAGEICVMVPDLICVLDSQSGAAVGTEVLRYGQRVSIVSLPATELLTSPEGLRHVGPRAFGFDLDYVSIHRHKAR